MNYNNYYCGVVMIVQYKFHFMKIQTFAIATIVAVLLSSCSSSKNGSLTYFEDIQGTVGSVAAGVPNVKITVGDELIITVNSFQPAATAAYNLPLSNPAITATITKTSTPTQQTYVVNASGDIEFPVLGKIHVEGMTLDELKDYLVERISKDVIDPIVRVEMVGFRVSVIGEVNLPGLHPAPSRERFTVLEAIALAGDLTEYGLRENVLLIREENGQRTYHTLNLNDSKLLESPYYYLKQNDVIVVSPNKIKQDNSKYNQNNAFKLSVVSTVVSVVSIIASLVIALTVK